MKKNFIPRGEKVLQAPELTGSIGWKPDVNNLRDSRNLTFLQLGSWTCSTSVTLRQPCLAPFASGLFLWGSYYAVFRTPEKFLRRRWLSMVGLSLRKWSRSIARCLWEAESRGLHRMIGPGSLVVGSWFPLPKSWVGRGSHPEAPDFSCEKSNFLR